MLVHPSSGACDLFVDYCSVSMCVGVTVWLGWGVVVSSCRLKYSFSLQSNKSTNKPQDPEDGCTNIQNMLSSK